MVRLWTLNALIVVCIAFVLFIVGYATPHWLEDNTNDDIHLGLWAMCSPTCHIHGWSMDYLLATQAMETMGLIVSIFTLPILGLHLYVSGREGADTIEYVSWKAGLVASVTSCIFILLGVIIIGTKYMEIGPKSSYPFTGTDFILSWSFGLATASACLYFIAGAMMTIDKLQS